MQPLAAASPTHIMASDLRGTTIYGANDENIGEIDDIVLERDGRIAAVVVGVGGFLGIGEKSVAIPFQALEIQERGRGSSGTTGTQGNPNRASEKSGTMQPDRILLRGMTKQDLEAAPRFKTSGR
jgi:sporulation protein YlmC with PRC-barrel domain